MTDAVFANEAGGASPRATVRVWDPFVRVFHWSLVTLVVLALATGDEIEWLHLWAGYAIAVLTGLRIVWGFVGTKHAQFSEFVKPPSEVVRFLGQSLRLKAARYVGHNPAGGAMVVAMLMLIGVIAATGFMLTTDAFWGSEALETHAAAAYSLIALVCVHVAGVILASFEHRENLVWAMLTGRKRT